MNPFAGTMMLPQPPAAAVRVVAAPSDSKRDVADEERRGRVDAAVDAALDLSSSAAAEARSSQSCGQRPVHTQSQSDLDATPAWCIKAEDEYEFND